MNIAQLYDTIILRDLFEYAMPGFVVLCGFGFLVESIVKKMGAGFSVLTLIGQDGVILVVLLLLLCFPLGHFLTGVTSFLFRRKEESYALEELQKNEFLKTQVEHVVSHYLHISKAKSAKVLSDMKAVATIRRMARDSILVQMPSLYREHLGRMSIVSRLCQNSAMALAFCSVCIGSSIIVLWADLQAKLQVGPLVLFFLVVGILVIGILLFAVLVKRSMELRRRLIKFAFHLWCVWFRLETEKKDSRTKSVLHHPEGS